MSYRANPGNLVIYADDDIDDIEMVKEGFAKISKNVHLETFSDGTEVIDYLQSISARNIKPCLIILDINMPKMNGRDVLLWIRNCKEMQNIPVIIFTTSSNTLDKTFAKEHKASFITKPIDISQLNIIISHFIDHCEENVQSDSGKQLN